ncbi:MAG: M20 family metallopeptidase [Candidatus Hodarchaeota archaeon]
MDVVQLTKDLVSRRSDSHEKEVLIFLKSLFTDLNFPIIEIPTACGGGRNDLLILSKEINDGGKEDGLLFSGHMDVVPPGDINAWKTEPFTPTLSEDGCLIGRGTTDMKGGLAAFTTAFLDIIDIAKDGDKLIGLLYTVDEETSLKGAEAFCESKYSRLFTHAILGEPTSLFPVRGHKGVLFTKLHAKGKASHGSVPHLGINAITLAFDAFQLIEGEFLKQQEAHNHPILGTPTMNLGKIYGGSVPNMVPDACTMEIDRRVTGGEDINAILDGYKEIIKNFKVPEDAGIDLECINARAPYFVDDDDAFLSKIRDSLGPANTMNGYTEAGVFNDKANITTVILGPGGIHSAHTANESISIEQLIKAREIYEKIMLEHVKS